MSKMEKLTSILAVKEGDLIKITKVEENSSGMVKVGDFCSGRLVYEPEIGSSVFLLPNHGEGRGIKTSTIVNILKFTTFWIVNTRNSTYVFELIM